MNRSDSKHLIGVAWIIASLLAWQSHWTIASGAAMAAGGLNVLLGFAYFIEDRKR